MLKSIEISINCECKQQNFILISFGNIFIMESKQLQSNQHSINIIMGKKKQQKQHQLNHVLAKKVQKQQLKNILSKLSQNKQKNKAAVNALTPITQINQKRKIIQKQAKEKKFLLKSKAEEYQSQSQQLLKGIVQQTFQPKKFNIFEMNQFNSGKKTVINQEKHMQVLKQNKMVVEQNEDLQSKAKKAMNSDINFDKFGDKPLRIKQVDQQVKLSDDEGQPNSFKNVSHDNIRMPQGLRKIERTLELEQFRKKLPIYMKEQQIVETVNNNLVTLICGQTGSGKSTQLVQFLYQKNYNQLGKVAVTQPRRLATIALANRVAQQMGVKLGEQVGYQVRHDRRQSAQKSCIKFMTDGILLNQMSSDFLLSEYGVIVIDQAHQRKINTDILIGLLSKLILIRYKMSLQSQGFPLRLVIMSATMRISDFQNKILFNFHVPIVSVESRMFPVTIYHQKNTPQDYVEAAVQKCVKIHKKLPQGDVLIFLTGKDQIHKMAVMLQHRLDRQTYEQMDVQNESHNDHNKLEQEGLVSMLSNQNQSKRKDSINSIKSQKHNIVSKYVIFCLYSSLPMEGQQRIFIKQPAGTRKFIIATNIAQTSITIPNIRYVVDSGQEKHKFFQGVWRWRKGYGSKAMAQQRAGRAGRTTHGYCYRLYSPALYANYMEEHPPPEITKVPLDNVILQIKSIGIQNIFGFPFPTSPQPSKILKCLESLVQVGALTGQIIQKQFKETTKVTQLGKILSFIPVQPKLGKMLLVGRKKHIQKYVLLCVVLLTVQSIFLQDGLKDLSVSLQDENAKAKMIQQRKKKAREFKAKYSQFSKNSQKSDFIIAMNIVGHFFQNIFSNRKNRKQSFSNLPIQKVISSQCKKLSLNPNSLRELYYNTDQLCQIYQTLTESKIDLSAYKPPSAEQASSLVQIFLCSYVRNLCRLEQKNRYKNKDNEDIYISHTSPIYMKDQIFVSCIQFYSNAKGRKYMRFPFVVENYQLLSQFGTLQDIKEFAWRNNKIYGKTHAVLYGWQIPNLYIENPQTNLKYYAIAKYFLDGTIVQTLKAFSKFLNAPISSIKPDNLNIKVQKIVDAFRKDQLVNKERVKQNFKKYKDFLKQELRMWLNVKNFDAVYQKLRSSIQN